MLELKDVSVRYDTANILDRLSFKVGKGQWVMLIGPNGAGKSTSLGAIAQTVPYTGDIIIEGLSACALKPKQLARKVGVLSQNHYVGYSFSVEEVVRLGCYSRSEGLVKNSPQGCSEDIDRALAATGLSGLRNRCVLSLSGGELQRTFLAQVLAQDPDILLLDEPANHLDLIYQKEIFGLIDEWRKGTSSRAGRPEDSGRAVISVVHDLSLARLYGTHAVLMNKGRAEACGSTDEVMTSQNLDRVYGMDVGGWMRTLLSTWTR